MEASDWDAQRFGRLLTAWLYRPVMGKLVILKWLHRPKKARNKPVLANKHSYCQTKAAMGVGACQEFGSVA
jgi:hypothetical protein